MLCCSLLSLLAQQFTTSTRIPAREALVPPRAATRRLQHDARIRRVHEHRVEESVEAAIFSKQTFHVVLRESDKGCRDVWESRQFRRVGGLLALNDHAAGAIGGGSGF